MEGLRKLLSRLTGSNWTVELVECNPDRYGRRYRVEYEAVAHGGDVMRGGVPYYDPIVARASAARMVKDFSGNWKCPF